MALLQTKPAGNGGISDNVAVINAPDLTPVLKYTDVKEVKEVLKSCDGGEKTTPVTMSLKIAELPTTTNIEVGLWLQLTFHIAFIFQS